MKRVLSLCIYLFCACSLCFAQFEEALSDSFANESRVKADVVLSKFDSIPGKKILYSLQNKYYLVIAKISDHYMNYILSMDTACNITWIKNIDHDKEMGELRSKRFLPKNKRKLLKRLEEDGLTVMKGFEPNQYHRGFITSIPNATYVAGVPSYFVMKDERKNRYGEFCIDSLTLPCPIDPDLWAYLIRTLVENLE
jgi:hypothetical protein